MMTTLDVYNAASEQQRREMPDQVIRRTTLGKPCLFLVEDGATHIVRMLCTTLPDHLSHPGNSWLVPPPEVSDVITREGAQGIPPSLEFIDRLLTGHVIAETLYGLRTTALQHGAAGELADLLPGGHVQRRMADHIDELIRQAMPDFMPFIPDGYTEIEYLRTQYVNRMVEVIWAVIQETSPELLDYISRHDVQTSLANISSLLCIFDGDLSGISMDIREVIEHTLYLHPAAAIAFWTAYPKFMREIIQEAEELGMRFAVNSVLAKPADEAPPLPISEFERVWDASPRQRLDFDREG
jgi:hypothetical protein